LPIRKKILIREFRVNRDFASAKRAVGANTALAGVRRGVKADEEEEIRGQEGTAEDGGEFFACASSIVGQVWEVVGCKVSKHPVLEARGKAGFGVAAFFGSPVGEGEEGYV